MKTTHQISTQHNTGMAFTATINGHKVFMDTSVDDGGADAGPSPKKLMLASLAGCTGIDIVSILQKMKVQFSDFNIEVEASLTEEHPKIYDTVKIIYQIKLAANDHEKMEKAVALSKDKYCGVSAMFAHFAKITWEIVYVN